VNKIFIGLLFLFININIMGVSITPAFVGYILIWLGLKELPEVPVKERMSTVLLVSTALGVVTWLPFFGGGTLGLLLALASTLCKLAVTMQLVQAVEELSALYMAELAVETLRKRWVLMACLEVMAVLLNMLGNLMSVLALIAWLVAAVLYLAAFHQSRKQYAAVMGLD